MSEWQPTLAQHYHERTKYDPDTIAKKARSLNWDQQPIPYKDYKLGTTYDLKPYLNDPPKAEENWEKWQRLSRFLLLSYGVTARLETPSGDKILLRAAPSAGGLYPAEVYLIVRGLAFLPPGLYNYQCQTHSLVHFWEDSVWSDLQSACFWHSTLENTELALAVSSVFYRSAWRYEDRAYRRIFLDTGHLLGNFELAGSLCDYRPHLIGGFNDDGMNELLYLNPQEEGVITVAALADLLEIKQNLSPTTTALPSPANRSFPPNIPDGELLPYLHELTKIETEPKAVTKGIKDSEKEDKYNFPFCLKVSTTSQPIAWGDSLEGLQETIIKRRSTRGFNGQEITLDELKQLLSFTYQSQDYWLQGLDANPDFFDLNLISTFVAVSGVTDLEEGCYYYAPKTQELRQIRFKNFRRELHYLCLGQDLGRDASAIMFHTADLKQAIQLYGDRAYRYLHLDAGHLGQRLNLAAIYLKLGVSGIAGFFDNQVNEVLGIPEDEAVLYITTLGRPRRG
ncbi:SagB-type dehydrogenase domain protein [Halothece sp. PCC 7418]|uniref:SagB/ThcOx family dehydrogenase n=1 Tax=Halothece sp. (strain PCC 7418) TaxID=65093 RepID=UPI0002A05FE1|nr:SagB/ThcOx family dehydrogenase [Halothece sp. PCC 7418]AFZ43155.1 SagB-type dehydrogenase domain protein [Halothece sp. PCC 7418]